MRALVYGDQTALDGVDVERVAGDVRDPSALRETFRGCELVFHLAAKISITGDPDGIVRAINVDGVRHAAEAALASSVRRFVHCSSLHAFDMRRPRVIDEQSPRAGATHAAYDRSKAEGERALRVVMARGLDAVIVHPSGILGPFDFVPSRMGRVLLQLFRRSLPALVDGTFDWVDVRDVVAGLLAAAERGRSGENYILSGQNVSTRELARIAHGVTGVRPPRLVTPRSVARLGVPFAAAIGKLTGKEPLFTHEAIDAIEFPGAVSHAKATRELGHAPRPIAESIRDAYKCFEQRGALSAAGTRRRTAASGA